MKPMPLRAMDCATAPGGNSIMAPSASYASALPDVDETLRPPCLATRPPAAAMTKLDAVEMLNVLAPSPPVPTMSTRCVRSATSTRRASSRIARAAPVISPTVSFLTRNPIMIAAVICGDTSPRITWRMRSNISSSKISRCSIVRCRASWGVMGMGRGVSGRGMRAAASGGARDLEEVLQQRVAVLAEDGFGMELHAVDRVLAVAQAHDRLVAAVGIVRPGRDLEAVREAVGRDHQRMVARGLEAVGQPGEHACPGVADGRGLAVHDPAGAHHAAAVGLADGLVAEADAEDRRGRPQPRDHLQRHAR